MLVNLAEILLTSVEGVENILNLQRGPASHHGGGHDADDADGSEDLGGVLTDLHPHSRNVASEGLVGDLGDGLGSRVSSSVGDLGNGLGSRVSSSVDGGLGSGIDGSHLNISNQRVLSLPAESRRV